MVVVVVGGGGGGETLGNGGGRAKFIYMYVYITREELFLSRRYRFSALQLNTFSRLRPLYTRMRV